MSSGKIGRLIFRRVPFFTFFVISLFLEDNYCSQNNEYRSVANHPVQISDRNRPACMTRYDNSDGSRNYETQPIAEYESVF